MVPPNIGDGERLLRVAEGGQLALDCPASGVPTPAIVWRKMPDGEMLDSEVDEKSGRERLLLRALKRTDGGRFTCEAINDAGKASADFMVEVLVHPHILPSPDNYQIRVLEGDRARMECKPEGNPEPNVRWLKAGRPLTEMSNLILSPRGDALMILKTRRTDAGKYTCRLENIVGDTEGTFTVTVLVRPYINETLDQNPRALKGENIRLTCPVQGLPLPKVNWLKDGQQLAEADGEGGGGGNNRVRMEGQYDLSIFLVDTTDAGRYTCRAQNEVGQLDTEFELEVIAPPQFAAEGERNFEVIEGEGVTLVCPVEANPFPEIAWLHGTEPIEETANVRQSNDHKWLTLMQAALADGGKYVCRASNVAGQSEVDLTLRVLISPRIDKSNLVNNPLAILGKEVFLECPVSGIPQPTVIWQRNEHRIDVDGDDSRYGLQQENQTLVIRSVRLEDQGKYACLVRNKAGQQQEEFDVEVLVPPQMETESTEAQPVTKREGEVLQLVCPLKPSTLLIAPEKAEEELRVAWTKEGRPLEPAINPNIEIGELPWRRLNLRNTSLADAGIYKCVASNRAGQSYAKFSVEILSKPIIDISRNAPEPHVIAGRPITLWCPASGNPLPNVRWFLNGADIAGQLNGGRYRLLDQGQGLEIQPATADDVGLWTCQAENAAGTSTADISLDVWAEPTVRALVEDAIPIKQIGASITLLCEVHGNPMPVISWSLHDQIIIPSPGRVHISKGGQRLEIPRLRVEDAGEYYCIAQNEVASASDFVAVEILVPPTISRETMDLNPRLPVGRNLTLFCDVNAKPKPKIRWFHNGTPIDGLGDAASQQLRIAFGEERRFIQIQNITLAHRGAFQCEASNAAGKDSIEYSVDVFQAPIIVKGSTEQVVEGRVAMLECNASGEPTPLITWQRNGVLVETGVRYILEGSRLKVMDARSSDSGIYVCVATNEAGTDQQAFTLEVLIPPKVASIGSAQLVVPAGANATLKCSTRGYPQPQVHWSVQREATSPEEEDFLPLHLALQKDWDYAIDNEESSLRLFRIEHNGTRKFRCSGVNSAGIDETNIVVSVVRAPMLSNEGFLVLNVTEGQPMHFPCGVQQMSGTGEQLQWLRNGQQLSSSGNGHSNNGDNSNAVVVGADGSLEVPAVGLSHAGNYTCVVNNTAGTANATVFVNVGVVPKMPEYKENDGTRGRVIVQRGGTAELWCEAVGIPPPRISWFRDEQPLSKFVPTAVTATENIAASMGTLSSERKRTTAIFGDVQPEHAGVYTCVAENWAGRVNRTVDLVVLIPPSIVPEHENLWVENGQMVVIHCNASGSPEPIVNWVRVSDPPMDIVANNQKYQFLGTSLAIRHLDKNDHGIYHCLARNEAGQAIGVHHVHVKLPMSEMRRLYVECDQNGVPIKNTYMRDRGDRPQHGNDANRQYIHWQEEAEDLQSLPRNGTDGTLLICLQSTSASANNNGGVFAAGYREPRRVPSPLRTTTTRTAQQNCATGFVWNEHEKRCMKVDECGVHCQYKCEHSSRQCNCPTGYRLLDNGRCVDVNECAVRLPNAACLPGQLCFNQFGSFDCLAQPCPDKFRLDIAKRQCVPLCRHNCSAFELLPIHLHMLALRNGLLIGTALLRLTARDRHGKMLQHTKFQIVSESISLHTENANNNSSSQSTDFHFSIYADALNSGRATIHSRRKLNANARFRLFIRSSSSSNQSMEEEGASSSNSIGRQQQQRWHSNHLVLIAVSQFPF